MTIVVPVFPFTPDAVADAAEFLESLAGLRAEFGEQPEGWREMLSDPDFDASLASFWAFMAGREPSSDITATLQQALTVTEDRFTARVQSGAVPF